MIHVNEVPVAFVGYVRGPGIIGQVLGVKAGALRVPQDGYISYGRAHVQTCFHLPQFCSNGVTFTMWLWLESHMSNKHNIIVISAPLGGDTSGYVMKYQTSKGGNIRVRVKNVIQKFLQDGPVETDKWMHVASTWHSWFYLKSYINRCPIN